jgi:hypothetical protein
MVGLVGVCLVVMYFSGGGSLVSSCGLLIIVQWIQLVKGRRME